jgi:hypothetical protein
MTLLGKISHTNWDDQCSHVLKLQKPPQLELMKRMTSKLRNIGAQKHLGIGDASLEVAKGYKLLAWLWLSLGY